MEYKSENPDVCFTVPDRPTVRQQLDYHSKLAIEGGFYVKLWQAAQTLIDEWECGSLPDRDIDLDAETNPAVVDVIQWVGIRVNVHVNELENLPKN